MFSSASRIDELSVIVLTVHSVTPHVEYKLEDAPEHVGRKTRKFRREYSHEALAVRPLVGFVTFRRADSIYVRECICQSDSVSSTGPSRPAWVVLGWYRSAGAKERGTIALFAIPNRRFQGSV